MKPSYFNLKKIISLICLSISFFSNGTTLEFIGSREKVIELPGDKNTGLNAIYVAYNISEINEILLEGISGTIIDVSKYSNLGGGYAQEIPYSVDGNVIHIPSPEGNLGYIISTTEKNFYFWLVDYSVNRLHLESINLADEQDCDNTKIIINGKGNDIHYYSIDGRQITLSRDIKLNYQTLEWNSDQKLFGQVNAEKSLNSISGTVLLTPPFYCNTTVKVNGDRFLREWGMEESIESTLFSPNAIAVESEAVQTNLSDEESSNIISSETEGLGGSAPSDISFMGYITDGVLHTEWQIASDPDFEYILFRFNEQDISYSFTEEGRYYIRFIGSNADGSCEKIGETYTVIIGASDLRIPNAFSPNDDGINDVWKVGYRSLLEFKCWIFDSKGTQLYQFDDPSGGWDGKYHGKIVRPGVYYYIIQATGADGKKYKKSGDINILNYKKYGESTGGAME